MRTFGPRWFKDNSLIAEYSDHFGHAVTRHKQTLALNAAKVEAEHHSRPLRRAAMHMTEHTQCTVRTDQPRWLALHVVEIRPPDQRAIAKHPEIFVEMFNVQLHEDSGAGGFA